MNFIGLDGVVRRLDTKPSKHPMRNEAACKSKIQYECGQLIKQKFPAQPILEELPIPDHGFIFDFFLPNQRIAFEINGRQHKEYVPFFHGSKKGFLQSQIRDENKAKWCEINNITLYVVDSAKELMDILDGNRNE